MENVLIIGAGGAGLSCAIELKRAGWHPVVITKGTVFDGKTAAAQGGIQAAFGEGDSWEAHMEDTLKAGGGVGRPALAESLAKGAKGAIAWLESCGVRFDREGDTYRLSKAAGLSAPRVLSVGDQAGRGIVEALLTIVRTEEIEVRENCLVQSIERDEQGNFHLQLIESGEEKKVSSKCLVLAAGGAVPREKRAGMQGHLPGFLDSIELAAMLGAKIVSPDLMQFHPTGIVEPKALRRKRLPETMRGAGAELLNKKLERFVDPLETRNKLSQAIVTECEQGNGVVTGDGRVGVWLDTPMIDQHMGKGYLESQFPTFKQLFEDCGHDLTRERVLVYPIVHYSLGGIGIDEHSQTSVPGFFAAGEATWGVHGNDRLMGNSLLEIFVFGRISGQSAAAYLDNLEE